MKRILIADDHFIVRQGLRQILAAEYASAEIDEASTGHEAIEKARKSKWDIIILDINLPGRNGLEIVKQLKAEGNKSPVLILSMYNEDQYAVRMLKAGVSGYLNKATASDELINAVKKILSGRKYITQTMAEHLAHNLDTDTDQPLHYQTSDREFQVLRLLASGKTLSEIAEELSLSVPTISTYRARLLEKMNMRTNAELIHYAIQQGLT